MTAAHPGDLDAQIDLFGATRQRSHQTEAGAPIGGSARGYHRSHVSLAAR